MTDQNDSKGELNRRDILQAVGTTGAAMAGFTGVAGAAEQDDMDMNGIGVTSSFLDSEDDDKVRAYQEYIHDESKIEQAFNEHIGSIAQLMESEGVSPPSSLDDAEDLNIFPDRIEEQASANIVARFDDKDEILLHIYPQAKRAYAYVGSSTHKRLFDSDRGVKPAGCHYSHECVCGCSHSYSKRRYHCCLIPGGPSGCDLASTSCGCYPPPDECDDDNIFGP
jgi:hypothetical protein